MSDLLPGEATANFKVDQILAQDAAVAEFMAGLDESQRQSFEQIARGLGFIMFIEGTKRLGGPKKLSSEEQERVLIYQTDLYLQGAGALAEEIRRENKE